MLAWFGWSSFQQSRIQLHQDRVAQELARIASEISGTIRLVSELGSTLAVQLERRFDSDGRFPSRTSWDALSASFLSRSSVVRSLALSDGFVIQHVYPQAGNRAALGLDYRSIPDQWEAIARVTETGIPEWVGPLTLAQGRNAILYRIPLYSHIAPKQGPRTAYTTLAGPDGEPLIPLKPFIGVLSFILDKNQLRPQDPPVSVKRSVTGLQVAMTQNGSQTPSLVEGRSIPDGPHTVRYPLTIGQQNFTLIGAAPLPTLRTTHPHLTQIHLIALGIILIGIPVLLAITMSFWRKRVLAQWDLIDARDALTASADILKDRQTALRHAEDQASFCALTVDIGRALAAPIGSGITATSHLENRAKEFRATMDRPKRSELESFVTDVETLSALSNRTLLKNAGLIESFRAIAADQVNGTSRAFDIGAYLADCLQCLQSDPAADRCKLTLVCHEGVTLNLNPAPMFRMVHGLMAVLCALPDGSAQSDPDGLHETEDPDASLPEIVIETVLDSGTVIHLTISILDPRSDHADMLARSLVRIHDDIKQQWGLDTDIQPPVSRISDHRTITIPLQRHSVSG